MIPTVIVPTDEPPTDTDHRDLLTAIKLLSGQDCLRDASQAQMMLVSLTESRHADVSADAKAIMKSGLKNGWFEDRAPKYFDLQLLAETSLANYNKPSTAMRRQVAMLVAGLAALFIGGVMAFVVSNGDVENPTYVWMLPMVLIFVVIVGLVWYKVQLKNSR